jgi:hypothetical protein
VSLPADLAAAVARAGVDPTLPERLLEDALCAAITERRGYRGDWWVGDDGLWHVELLWPVRETFGGTTLAQALGWCLVGMMGWAGEVGAEAFA